MRRKVLTVDDSKAVRIIVKKAFKKHDVQIVEASNGVEGLTAAGKEAPDLILLDVTMPVMDGVEMLTKLKADANLKGIPVVMLTAEAGRENVMKIAKIGIRDYIVKPFKEDVLIDKVGRIIEITPLEAGGIAADSAKKIEVDQNFVTEDDYLKVSIPAGIDGDTVKVMTGSVAGKVGEAVDSGLSRVIVDGSALSELNDGIVGMIDAVIQNCRDLTLPCSVVASEGVSGQAANFGPSAEWKFCSTIDEAKNAGVTVG